MLRPLPSLLWLLLSCSWKLRVLLRGSMNIGVIVPTRNRPDFVERVQRWYAPHSDWITPYIGDYPNRNELQAAYAAAQQSNERYLAFHGDDDLMLPSTLKILASCLESSDTRIGIGSIRAEAVLFTMRGDGVWGEIEATKYHPDQLFRLYRREVLIEALSIAMDMPNLMQTSMMSGYDPDDIRAITFYNCVNAAGVANVDGRIHLFRQGHKRRTKAIAYPHPESLRTKLGRWLPRTQYAYTCLRVALGSRYENRFLLPALRRNEEVRKLEAFLWRPDWPKIGE